MDTSSAGSFVFDSSIMLPGDIILMSSKTIQSKVIQWKTGSDYSHAALYLGDKSLIDATSKGVHTSNTQRYSFDTINRIILLRANLDEVAIESICNFARSKYLTQYTKTDAIKAGLNFVVSRIDKQFCSRLVAEAYHDSGVNIVANPSFATPQDIHISELLNEVPGVLKALTADELAAFKNFQETTDYTKKQTEITHNLMNKVRNVFPKVQTIDDIMMHLANTPERDLKKVDGKIANCLRTCGYLDMWRWDLKVSPWRYDLSADFDKFQHWDMVSIRDLMIDEVESSKQTIERHSISNQSMIAALKSRKLKTFKAFKRLTQKLISITETRKAVALKVIEALNNQV